MEAGRSRHDLRGTSSAKRPQSGWVAKGIALLVISISGSRNAARQSLEISWGESDATSPSLKSAGMKVMQLHLL